MKGLIHIPHASKIIPKEYLGAFYISGEELSRELLLMTDHFTDELFAPQIEGFDCLQFPVSRLLVDPERFESDKVEIMSAVGMGCIYERTHDGRSLKSAHQIREELLTKFYRPHHLEFQSKVSSILDENDTCLIVDCHSFPKLPLPYELHQEPTRAEVCIGTDEYHTPTWLIEFMIENFQSFGFSVAIDKPFAGSIVPSAYWRNTKAVCSVMIEIRRDLYMNEQVGNKSKNFERIQTSINKILNRLMKQYLK